MSLQAVGQTVRHPAFRLAITDMAGTSLADLRHRVRKEMRGVHTCTHLNDTMRAIADLDVLLGVVVPAPPAAG